MKNSIFTMLLLLLMSAQAHSQNQSDITEHYQDFISVRKITTEDRTLFIKTINQTQNKNYYSDLINDNSLLLDYLLVNFSSPKNYEEILKSADSTTIKKTVIDDLKKDSLFTSVMRELVDKTLESPFKKDTVSINTLLNIAVKNFSLTRVSNEGTYVGRICVGVNDIKKTESKRSPFVEAFAFSSVFKNIRGEEFNMYDEFVGSVKELYKLNLGIDKNEQLLRAQGALFILMRNNQPLKEMLKSEYEKHKEYLPFILIDN